ncbi:PQQ-dependent sugar dehydrogenase [Seohaeicola nanhaiensis]|uniref:PQQ-dependent sugar dehydrogenase n=1 Tax=Seohaeicola nanhaiensis TaxID=1387282 RepID=A0ABV9KPJ4_9RHOB
MRLLSCLISILSLGLPAALAAQPLADQVTLTRMADGLKEPWAVDVLPDGGFLVTEREGAMWHFTNNGRHRLSGVPEVRARGQGGLLDVTVARDFDRTRALFLTYVLPQETGGSTALAVARLSEDGTALEDVKRIFAARPAGSSGHHFGSRVVEAADGTLYVTLGERGHGPSAQDLASHNGSTVRINRDGTVPKDNPFVGRAGALPEIWSYGHRNVQGAALDLDGRLITSEHGAKGGDEINRSIRGANFGWPVISYGVHYTGAKIGEGTRKEGMEQPAFYWDPSIAPSGLMVYSGRLWPEWKGDVFVGSLKFDYIARLNGEPMQEAEQLKGPETQRVRDVIEAPDGSIWFLSVGQGAVYRMTPR